MKDLKRAKRRAEKEKHFLRRLKNYLYGIDSLIVRGEHVIYPKLQDILNWEGNHFLKTTGKPCSCIMCSPNKYNRSEFKKKDEYDI